MSMVLRYFEARGRVQPLRHLLADSGVEFEDVRVSVAAYPPYRQDPSFSGWFGSLPTLSWGADTIAEALPITTYVSQRLGHYDGLAPARVARLEAICSCIYIDIITRLGEILWASVLYPGADLGATVPRSLGRMLDKLWRVSELLGADEQWYGGGRPLSADFFAAEGVESLQQVLGASREAALRERLPAAFRHAERLRARPALARRWPERPANLTASPDEAALIERLQQFDLSSIGL